MNTKTEQDIAIKLIWAQANGGVIGKNGDMPWHLPEDLAHFKACTQGHTVLMGRKTWDSIPEKFRPLPNRTNLVLTRQSNWHAQGATVVHSLEQALQAVRASDSNTLWVMGGAQVYALCLPLASHLEITFIELDVARADAHAPNIDPNTWDKQCDAPHNSKTGLRYRFCQFTRKP